MGLKDMSLQVDATITASDGSPIAFSDDGVSIQNGLHLIVPADTDYQTRRQLTIKYRQPSIDPKTNTYSKDKKSVCLAFPQVLTNGSIVFNTVRIEREVHPSTPAAVARQLNLLGAQLLSDVNTDAFWAVGSLS